MHDQGIFPFGESQLVKSMATYPTETLLSSGRPNLDEFGSRQWLGTTLDIMKKPLLSFLFCLGVAISAPGKTEAQTHEQHPVTEPLRLVEPESALKMHPTFVHPGLLHTQADIKRIKDHLSVEPWKSALASLKATKWAGRSIAATDYQMRGPFDIVHREPNNPNRGNIELETDGRAAWYQALLWQLTGDKVYADNAIKILNAWSLTLTQIEGKDAQLAAGDNGINLCNGAELLRYSNAGWKAEDIAQFEKMLQSVFYPQIRRIGDANWGGSALKTMISIAVFCNDQSMMDYAILAAQTHPCASITKNNAPSGQNSESGRDQTHSLGGIGNLIVVSQIAWNQGYDLFSEGDNRLLAALEYWAKYNLGEDVPFDPSFHRCTMGPWKEISPKARSASIDWAPVELIYSHYVQGQGLSAPYSKRYRDGLSPNANTLFFRLPARP